MTERLKKWAATLRREVLTLWFCCRDPRVSWPARLLTILVVAYAFSPIDLIPDFIPVLGLLDDLIVLPLGVYCCLRLVPEPIRQDARQQAEQWLAQDKDKPRNLWAAGIILLLWAALATGAFLMVQNARGD